MGRLGRTRGGFTLIELLVVIAIIAVLVGLLLPALGRVRNTARMVVSQSNVRQQMQGVASYRNDFGAEIFPIQPSAGPNAAGPSSRFTSAWCTWNYGGKHADRWWNDNRFTFDHPASKRPLNFYVYPGFDPVPYGPGSSEGYRPPPEGRSLELEVFQSPGDVVTYQREGPYPTPLYTLDHGSYSDVGTSYHLNMKWIFELTTFSAWNSSPPPGIDPPDGVFPYNDPGNGRWEFWNGNPDDYDRTWLGATFEEGMRRMALGSSFSPSEFVFLGDETADIVVFDGQGRDWVGEFGDVNRAVLGFLDGHVSYTKMVPNVTSTNDYTFFFNKPAETRDDP